MRQARSTSRVQTLPARPYGEAFARVSASSSPSKGFHRDHGAEDLLGHDALGKVLAGDRRRLHVCAAELLA